MVDVLMFIGFRVAVDAEGEVKVRLKKERESRADEPLC